MHRHVTIFDTSIATDNIGDEIIMDSVLREARALFPEGFFVRVPTHDRIGPAGRRASRESDVALVGGTNLLTAHWLFKKQWQVGLFDFWRIGRPVLMGVGWRHYQKAVDPITGPLLKRMLSRDRLHSVRDAYTLSRLGEMGIGNVVNTGCPTMWRLTEEHCVGISQERAPNLLTTVTAYRHAPELDRKWLEMASSHYQKVYFWPQMFDDFEYFKAIAPKNAEILEPSLAAYDRAIEGYDVDYLGTRLHGGVRVLQKKRRALILEVDNRATEIARDTGLTTARRDDLTRMAAWIEQPEPVRITMPWDEIARWKAQFADG